MHISITGINLPGRCCPRPDGTLMNDVHVGVQVGQDPAQLVRADAPEANWQLDVDVVHRDGTLDFRGPAVQGRRGERFVYLTWGDVNPTAHFERFRRAKLMLHRIDDAVLDEAIQTGRLAATVDLTGPDGLPRCARVDPPAITWSSAAT